MPSYPSFLLPEDSVKIRFREQFASQALNMKTGGIVPPGIYNGFTPSVDPLATSVLLLNTDPYRNDSVAAGDIYNLTGAIWTADYNLTIRTTLQVQLDFTGHAVFPCWVVLRPAYSIVSHPFSGLTNAQLVTINTLTVDDTDTFALHHGDVKICRIASAPPLITAGPGQNVFTLPADRDDNGGSLVTQTQINGTGLFFKSAASKNSTAGAFATNSLTFVPVPDFDTLPLVFSTTNSGEAVCWAFTTVVGSGAGSDQLNTSLGIRVDGVDYPLTFSFSGNVGGMPSLGLSGFAHIPVLAAGAHTAQAVIRWGGTHYQAYVQNNAFAPTGILIMHKG
jgi:hypothetical protein